MEKKVEEDKIKVFGISTYDKYLEYKEQLKSINYPYVEKHKGSIIRIECNNRVWQYKKGAEDNENENLRNIKSMGNKGFHISKMVRKDVEEYIEKTGDDFDYKAINSLRAYEELYNNEALLKCINKNMWSIDIDDCYWDTFYKLGYISFFTYIRALKKREWKFGRNASLGSLAAKTKVYEYEGDKLINSYEIPADEKLCAIRNHVIFSVWEIFRDILIENGNNVLMFFKDCTYVSNKITVKKILDFLTTKGYIYKIRSHRLINYTPETGLVEWYCYDDEERRKKYYKFIEEQEITNIGL
jgi:hypothetical protein